MFVLTVVKIILYYLFIANSYLFLFYVLNPQYPWKKKINPIKMIEKLERDIYIKAGNFDDRSCIRNVPNNQCEVPTWNQDLT